MRDRETENVENRLVDTGVGRRGGMTWEMRNGIYTLHSMSLQSCPILCEAMDHNPPGYFVQGIFQSKILEWIAMPFSRGSS